MTNPNDEAVVKELGKLVAKRVVRKPGPRHAPTLVEFRNIYMRGFNLNRSYGFHQRLCMVFMKLGCLRRGTIAAQLRTLYGILQEGSVAFDPASDV